MKCFRNDPSEKCGDSTFGDQCAGPPDSGVVGTHVSVLGTGHPRRSPTPGNSQDCKSECFQISPATLVGVGVPVVAVEDFDDNKQTVNQWRACKAQTYQKLKNIK